MNNFPMLAYTNNGYVVVFYDGSYTGTRIFLENRGYQGVTIIGSASDKDIASYPNIRRSK